MGGDLVVGEKVTYYGYDILKEGIEEYRVSFYADDIEKAKEIIKKCLEAGIIEWPLQTAGRRKKGG